MATHSFTLIRFTSTEPLAESTQAYMSVMDELVRVLKAKNITIRTPVNSAGVPEALEIDAAGALNLINLLEDSI